MYIVDIEFDGTEREYAYNEIYPPIIEKQKTIDPCERSVFQLLEQFVRGEKDPKAYRATAKVHANLFKKNFFANVFRVFCIKRAGWKVTKIHSHLTFEQARFKQNFILMNQKSRQKSKNIVEKDFYKLMNNPNFGYNCRNNIANCKFVPIFDEHKEITFVTSDLLKSQIEEEYNDKLMKLDQEDKFYKIKLQTLKTERLSSLEAAEKIDQKKF